MKLLLHLQSPSTILALIKEQKSFPPFNLIVSLIVSLIGVRLLSTNKYRHVVLIATFKPMYLAHFDTWNYTIL